MFCNPTAFELGSGCPNIQVNMSFPVLSYCSSPVFNSPNKPNLNVPFNLPSPDVAPPSVFCIEIEPITEVGTDEPGLKGEFGLQSGVTSCETGKYRLKYRLDVGCPLLGLAGTKPLHYNGAEIGRIIFKVTGCSLDIEAQASCMGGVVIETCPPRTIENAPIDIPIIFTAVDENTFAVGKEGCYLYASAQLKMPSTPPGFSGGIGVTRQGDTWLASLVPHITNCSLYDLSVHIRIPTAGAFGFTFEKTPSSLLNVQKVDDNYFVVWDDLRLYSGPTGDRGQKGSSPYCYEGGVIVTCKVSGLDGIMGPTGLTGPTGATGSVYKVSGSRGPTGFIITGVAGGCSALEDKYVQACVAAGGLDSFDIWLTKPSSNTVNIMVQNCNRGVQVCRTESGGSITLDTITCSDTRISTNFIGTC